MPRFQLVFYFVIGEPIKLCNFVYTIQIRDLLKSRVESPEFLDKIGSLYQVNTGNFLNLKQVFAICPPIFVIKQLCSELSETSFSICSHISVIIQLCSEPYVFLDEAASWSIINKAEAWEVKNFCGDGESDQDGFVLVKQEDIVEGIACFMAAYLLSLKETKVLFI